MNRWSLRAIPEVVDYLPPVEEFTGPGFSQVHHEHIAAVPTATEFFPMSDDEGDELSAGLRPAPLWEPLPQEQVQRHTVNEAGYRDLRARSGPRCSCAAAGRGSRWSNSSISSTRLWLPSRLSKCRRSRWTWLGIVLGTIYVRRRRRNSWWMYRRLSPTLPCSCALPSRSLTFQVLQIVVAASVKEAFMAFLQGWSQWWGRGTSYIGWTNSAAAGPGRWPALGGGSCRTPLSWSGGMSPTSPVRVQFLGKVVDMPIVLQFFDKVAYVPVVQVQPLRFCADRGVAPQIIEEIVKVLGLRFCCTPMACLPLPVVRVSTWCFGCWLRNSRWHRLLKVKDSWEVAQDTAEARGDSTGAVLGLVFHARRCSTTGPSGPDSSVWRCRQVQFLRLWTSLGWVQPVLKTVEVPQLQYFQGGRVPVVLAQFPSAGVEKTAELPLCSRRALDKVVDMPVCATTSARGAVQQCCSLDVSVIMEVPQILFIARVCGPSVCTETCDFHLGLGDEGVGAHHTGDELN